MTKITAEAIAQELAPQEQRVIIFCKTCNSLSVGTVRAKKLPEAFDILNQGKHKGHKFITEIAGEHYAKVESNPQTRASKEYYDQVVTKNDGIYIY